MGLVLVFSLLVQDCSKTSTGFTPLNDLGPGTYNGYQGGLYPGGSNVRPAAHEAAGLTLASQIQPVDASGTPDPNGKIGMASIGMSNTNQEFQPFIGLALSDPAVNKRLVFVNGAEPSRTAEQWADPNHWVWSLFANKLFMAGLSPQQLQVVWIKLVAPSWMIPSTFPDGALQVEAWLRKVVQNVKAKYPSVKIAYLSSRIYGHYATITLSSEPYAYENGFSVKWLIEKQISGDPDLAYDGPSPKAPWLSWGPYLWADGVGPDGVPGGAPGRSDGLEWKCSDFIIDGTHPSSFGAQKVAQMLLDFLKSDPTSTPWFVDSSGAGSPPPGGTSGGGVPGCGLVGIEVLLLLAILRRRP